MTPDLEVEALPWSLQPAYRDHPRYRRATSAERRWVDAFARDGYVVVPAVVPPELAAAVVESIRTSASRDRRLSDAWRWSEPARRLATWPGALEVVELLHDAPPIPFQTLHFAAGSEQSAHDDAFHFDSRPAGAMCGMWVALEDVGPSQGPLVVHPGSHRLRVDRPPPAPRPSAVDHEAYEAAALAALRDAGIAGRELHLGVGDLVIWSARLLHGGAPVDDVGASRWSQVTHAFFPGRTYVTPMLSDTVAGRYWVRSPLVDIRTGRRVRHLVDGRRARWVDAGRGRSRLVDRVRPSDLPGLVRGAVRSRGRAASTAVQARVRR